MPATPPLKPADGATPIRDAGCMILVDRSESAPRLLMGRRLPTQVFLPDKWVFPGGRVDDDDRTLAEHLCAPSGFSREAYPNANGAAALTHAQLPFALAAIRETLEETGHFIGRPQDNQPTGVPPAWQAIANLGLSPNLEHVRPLARAITPPGFPRRFDTWFFVADWHADTRAVAEPDGELAALDWFTLDAVRSLDLPLITRMIVDDVAMQLANSESAGIPFYFQDDDEYRRVLLKPEGAYWQP